MIGNRLIHRDLQKKIFAVLVLIKDLEFLASSSSSCFMLQVEAELYF